MIVMQTKREEYTDIISLLREIEGKKLTDAQVAALDIHSKDIQENAQDKTHKRRELIKYLFGKTEDHHTYAHKVKYTEHNGTACKKGQHKGHYHTDEEALYTSFHIV